MSDRITRHVFGAVVGGLLAVLMVSTWPSTMRALAKVFPRETLVVVCESPPLQNCQGVVPLTVVIPGPPLLHTAAAHRPEIFGFEREP